MADHEPPAEPPAEEEPEAPPTPSWRPFLVSLAAPEEYGLEPLLAQASGLDRFEVVEVVEAAKAAAGDLGAEIKAWEAEHAGEELPGSLIAKFLVAKVDEERAAGILKKQEPPPEPTEEEAAPAEEGAPPPPPPKPTGPDPEVSADIYYVLKGFPRTAEDAAAMAEAGLSLDTLLSLNLNKLSLRNSAAAAAPAEAAPAKGAPPAKGKKGAPEPVAAAAPAEEAEAPDLEPEEGDEEELPPPPICAAMAAAGSDVGDTAVLQCGMADPKAWAKPSVVMERVAALCFAAAQKKVFYEEWKAPLRLISIGAPEVEVETSHYRQLLATAGPGCSVAYVLHALVEQVARSCAEQGDVSMLEAEEEVGEMERLLALHGAAMALVPKSYAQRAVEAAAKASAGAALVEDCDAVQLRALVPSAHGTAAVEAAACEAQRQAEADLYASLPMPAKGRQGMPYEAALSKEERGVERTELHHYSKFAPPVLDASMQLRTISQAINAADASRGAKDETGWQLCDRLWTEELSAALMAQVVTAARASSLRPVELTSYHARDDVLMLAFHKPVPASREATATWRCAVHDLLSRKFGDWHAWLLPGRDGAEVPPPPRCPPGGSLYELLRPTAASLLTTSSSLYPSDHMVVRLTSSAEGAEATVQSLHGFFCRYWQEAAAPPPAGLDRAPAQLALTFERTSVRAVAGCAADGAWRVAVGSDTGQEATVSTEGEVTLLPPPLWSDGKSSAPRAAAATLMLSGLAAAGLVEVDAAGAPLGAPYVRVVVLGVEEESAAATPAAAAAAPELAWEGEVLRLPLEEGGPRPAKLRVELWDADWQAGEDGGGPLATAEVELPADAEAGEVAELALAPREDMAEALAAATLSFSFALANSDSAAPPPRVAPPAREVARRVLPSGAVLRSLDDGSRTLYLRSGNVGACAGPDGPHAGSWVSTNLAGLRAGTRPDTGEEFYMPSVAVAPSSDPVTHHVITTRADGTLVLVREDGSRVCQFADGTVIESSAEAEENNGTRGEVSVRCEGLPSVLSNLKTGELSVAMHDGVRLVRTCPKSTGSVAVHHPDGSSLSLEAGGRAELKPAALATLARGEEESGGSYFFDLLTGELHSVDHEGNKFEVRLGSDHRVELVLKDDLAGDTDAAMDEGAAAPDDPEWCHPPRLLLCRPDGSGAELWRHADVRSFLHARAAGVEQGVAQEQQLPFPADPDATVQTYVWRDAMTLRNAAEAEAAATSDAHTLIGLRPKLPPSLEERTLLRHRRLIKREPLSAAERGVLETELAAMGEWMTGEEEKATELHVVDTRSAEEKAAEAQVQRLLEADVAASA